MSALLKLFTALLTVCFIVLICFLAYWLIGISFSIHISGGIILYIIMQDNSCPYLFISYLLKVQTVVALCAVFKVYLLMYVWYCSLHHGWFGVQEIVDLPKEKCNFYTATNIARMAFNSNVVSNVHLCIWQFYSFTVNGHETESLSIAWHIVGISLTITWVTMMALSKRR